MLAGNSSLRRRLRFMPGDFKYQETKAPPLKDAYDEFLARIICYVFSVSPEPFVSHVNRATAQVSQKRGTDEGLAPLQRYVSGSINRIIAEEFDSPDLEFAWQDGVEQDPAEAAKINVAYVQAGILSAAEVRQSLGLERGEAEVQKSGSLEVRKYNSRHKPAGNPEGGQFDVADGGEDAASDSASSTTGSEVIDSVLSGLQTLLGSLGDMLSGLQDALSGSEEGLEEIDGDFTADDNVSNEAAPTASARQTIRTKTRSTDLSGYTQLAADNGIQSDAVPESWGGNPKDFIKHFEKHGSDFGAASAEDYAAKANEFLK